MFLAPDVPMHGNLFGISNGRAGIFETIAIMRNIVKQYRINLEIRNAAISVIFLTPERDELSEVTALFNFVRDSIRYVRDINAVETISTPDKTLESQIGDCDDQSLLLAALYESVGYPTRFVVAGYQSKGILEHVYLQVLAADAWHDADPTEHRAFGYSPPDPLDLYIESV